MPLTVGWLASDAVGVFLMTVNRRLLLVGVDVGHFEDDDDGKSAQGTSVLVDACGDVCTGPLTTAAATIGCRI